LNNLKNSYNWNFLMSTDRDISYLLTLNLAVSTHEIQNFACSFIENRLKYSIDCWT
jgi:hypothetical protein